MSGGYRRALVTGGAGFIGSSLVRALLARGLEVVVLDNLSVGRRENVPPQAAFVLGDVRDGEGVRTAVADVDVVFHLAARVSVRASFAALSADAEVNVLGTVRLLEACRGSRVRKLIYASSMAVYADAAPGSLVDEAHPTEPQSPYGVSKLAGERYTLLVAGELGIPAVALRYFNVYGPGQAYTPYVGVITIFTHRLLAGDPPVIFGDGNARRDFVHVADVVAATLLAMERDVSGEAINVGTGVGTTVQEVAALLTDRLRPGLAPVWVAAQPGELQHSVADIRQARRLLGYSPTRRLTEDIDPVIAWCQGAVAPEPSAKRDG